MTESRRLVRFDWFVKFMLRDKSNFEILEGFLSELLKEDIRILEILDPESNKKSSKDRFNRVDILVRNDKDERIIVEIQNNKEYDYLQRILFGAAKTLTENISEGQPYSDLKKVISVSVVYFEAGQGIDYIYHGQTVFTGIHQNDVLALSEEQQGMYGKALPQDLYPEYYLIKAADFDENIKNPLDEWVYFFKKGQIKGTFEAKGLEKAKKKLDVAKLSPAQRGEYERYLDEQRSLASYNETLQKDLDDALKQGREEGREEGAYQAKYETAENALRSGATIAFTMQITGLPESLLQEIKRRIEE
jgi:predicted transposase/invertase (TIGR01784 family)